MKKLLLSVVVILAFVFQTIGQSKLVLPEAQYQDLKAKGKLKEGVSYVPVANVHPDFSARKISSKQNKSSMGGGGLGCSCYITPDASYTLAMAPNDDGSTGLINIPFNFCLYGTSYTSLYVNNNGNISFGSPYSTFSSFPFPDPTYVMVAPFWGDVDTRGAGTVKYKITSTYMIVNWEAVGYYANYTDKLNSFQLIITDGTDPILPAGNNIAFCYQDMQWTTGDASGGSGTGFGGTPSTVGINQGAPGNNYIQMGRFDQPGIAYDGGYGNNDGVSWLDNQSLYFNVCSATNIAPIASGLNNCDTIKICGSGDTLYLNGLFLAPEIGQNTTISVNLLGTPNATVISNTPGNSATAIVQIIATAANAGINTIQFTATDNGIPAGTTVVNVNIFVDTTGVSNFNPVISGNLEFCEGGSSVLNVNPITYDSYVWSTGAFGTTITVDTTGTYYVTASLNGCYKSTSVNVIDNPLPIPIITGPTFTCNGNPTTIYLNNSSVYQSYVWSNSIVNDSVSTNGGTFTVTVTDTNGCVGQSASITITNLTPLVSITPSSIPFCPGQSGTLTAVPTIPSGVSYVWSNNDITQSTVVTTAGTYTVTINYSNGCSADTTISVSLFDGPVALFSSSPNGNTTVFNPITFTSLSTIASGTITSWSWNFGDTTGVYYYGPIQTHSYSVNGTYTVTLLVCSNNGCCDTVQFPYTIQSDIETPNVFTPNSGLGQLNSHLYFKNLEYFPGTKLQVFNRWGNKVYENIDYASYQKETYGWDGGKQTDGVYYYVLDGPMLSEPKFGFVQLLR